ncbi:uncharacterized protein LOC132624596 [Lycium barbarum]|uniref:uncharacterized protein LOC132624596 n=1 Tax=Lycium barbarum TaxID=112863 RepID=UPI00293E2D50|nr:uncharacterized protein LOC132624596 [Lycium barbarum]
MGTTANANGDSATMIDHHHPLFLQACDTPGNSLVAIQLTSSENYASWYRYMKIGLLGKGKLGFIDGKCAYFSRMKELWEEFDSTMPCLGFPCPESKTYAEHFEYQRLMQFFMGLNDSFNQYRSRIMMMYPIPSVNKAYSLIIAEECQRILGKSNYVDNGGAHDGITFFGSKGNINFPRSNSKQSIIPSDSFGGK